MTGADQPAVTFASVRTHEALVVVDSVRVRWRVDTTSSPPVPNWRCDEHGHARCHHVAEAAARIASQLLGIPATVTTTEGENPA